MLGKGEELTGGRTRTSILSDAFEAVIGAIYLDGGMKNARMFIHSQMGKLIEDSVKGVIFMDFKTQLQEVIQKDGEKKITYEIIDEKGPDHEKVFIAQVKVMNKVLGIGNGKSKKEAEQAAARAALEKR
jgi:ribonuclease-3